MTTQTSNLERFVGGEYPQGFVTEVEMDKFEPGLSEAVVRQISARKNEPDFMAYRKNKHPFSENPRLLNAYPTTDCPNATT